MFDPQERLIFGYKVGGDQRFADPLEIRRGLIRESGGCIWQWVEDCRRGSGPEGAPAGPDEELACELAREKVVACTRAVFGLAAVNPATGEGVLEQHVWEVFNAFSDFWLGEKKPGGN